MGIDSAERRHGRTGRSQLFEVVPRKESMRSLVVVMVHKEAQEVYDRHLRFWEANSPDIVCFCPEDSIVNPHGHRIWAYGQRGHHNVWGNRRFKECINMAWNTTYQRVCVFEYDAICVQQNIPVFFEWDLRQVTDGLGVGLASRKDFSHPYLAANVFRDNRPDRGFIGTTFTHPPLIFSRQGLDVIRPLLNALPDDAESFFWDRTLGLALENGGIEPFDLMKAGLGYAQNTIEVQHYASAHEAACKGAIFWHGVKSEGALEVILNGHEIAKQHGTLRQGLEVAL